jgi:hypothetical protein
MLSFQSPHPLTSAVTVPSLDLGKTPKFTIKKEKPQRKWRGILRVFCTTIFSQYIYIYIYIYKEEITRTDSVL